MDPWCDTRMQHVNALQLWKMRTLHSQLNMKVNPITNSIDGCKFL